MKQFLAGFFTCYILAGAAIGLGLKWAVPATNYFGVAYITVIWPWWLSTPIFGTEPPVPAWCFTFPEPKK